LEQNKGLIATNVFIGTLDMFKPRIAELKRRFVGNH